MPFPLKRFQQETFQNTQTTEGTALVEEQSHNSFSGWQEELAKLVFCYMHYFFVMPLCIHLEMAGERLEISHYHRLFFSVRLLDT